ncbi:sensor histidine kinase [Natranaerofaba carboxydovora]|uniref:sensor histidine kinase n=1 Tax=Natranaerofaba carboxydovora TaxID=2742683 RepID=UPI001F137F59|nr:sensor histidine kinase [Natranaerofaba carboxydovora]UMZ74353.1 Nitrate/nitrite sensor protein NarX [Natranaerofaba carboxydovora]
MPEEYFFLYLIYGSVFITMGLFAIQRKDVKVSNFQLVKAMKYLGIFGIAHGLSEWVTMVVIADLYPDSYTTIFIIKQVLKAVSFAFLMYFGFILLPLKEKLKKWTNKIPFILLASWFGGFIFLMSYYSFDYHIIHPEYNTIFLRYILSFLGGISSALALYLNGNLMEKRKLGKIASKYKKLAVIILIYGIIDGLFVSPDNFFPANVINNDLFENIFRFPIQVGKIATGIGINILLVKVIETFSWEQKEKLNLLQKQRTISEERRKLGMEIHDSIIQVLYSAGLKVEYIMKNKTGEKADELLKEVKADLNSAVDKTREFLESTATQTVEFEDLQSNLQKLVDEFNNSHDMDISLKSEMPSYTLGQLSPEKSTQVYYIVQEAISNVLKHSKATKAEVFMYSNYDYLLVRVTDNGIGISKDDLHKNKQLGIRSMRERAERAEGSFKIKRLQNGTMVETVIPWEGTEDEELNKSIVS